MATIIDEIDPLFKTCTMCKTTWDTMDSFLADPQLSFNGYQANFGELDQGILFFTHDTNDCGSTIGLRVRTFASLFSGPRYASNLQLSNHCPRYCIDHYNLERCSAKCENAYAREISQIIKDKLGHPA